MITGFMLAAYLGPQSLGVYSYALAFIGFFTYFISLGYDGYLKSDLLLQTDNHDVILGSAAFLRVLGAFVAITTVWVITALTPLMPGAVWYIRILSFTLLFQAGDVIELLFRAQSKSRQASLARIIASVGSNVSRVILIILHCSLTAFVINVVAEVLLASLLLIIFYGAGWRRWKISSARVSYVVRQSLPLLINGISYFIYMRIDQIMLGQMRNPAELGLYAASVRFFEVPMAILLITDVVLHPFQVEQFKAGAAVFMRYLRLVCEGYTLVAYVLMAVMIGFAPLIIRILPESFASASSLIRIEYIGLIFVFNGNVRHIFYDLHRKQRILAAITILSMLLNVGLNFLWIPTYGAAGAAWATVATQITAFLIMNAFWAKSRTLFFTQLKSLIPVKIFRYISEQL
jgi:PST family polysaccharide transporter